MLKRSMLAIVVIVSFLSLAAGETVEEKYPSGKVKRKYQTDAQGKRAGFYVEYFENGRVKVRATCKADAFDGPYTELYPNGTTHTTITYKAGRRAGAYTELDDKGKKKLTAGYRDDKLHGVLKQYDKGKEVFTHAFKDGEPVFSRTLDKTRATLEQLTTPSEAEKTASPAEAERMAALRRLKAYRFLCGVPYENLELDPELNRYCEAGAKLCEKIGRIEHTPANPGLPEEEYQAGYKGTSHSNLHQGQKNLAHSVDGYMNDSDARNIAHVGHRRWCINPSMQKTGFGRSAGFCAMWSFDKSQPVVPDYNFISYPPNGYIPIQYISRRHAWNISLHPRKFLAPDQSVKVTVYEVDPFLYRVGEPLSFNHNSVDTTGPGIPYCLIFRPENARLEDGQRYMIEVEGLRDVLGRPVPLRFLVVFVDLNAKSAG
jgi:hypothetical protein